MVALCFVPIPSPIGCSPVERVVFVLSFHRMNTNRWRDSSLQSWNLHSGWATSWGLSVVPRVEYESKSEGVGFSEFLSLTGPCSPVGTILWLPWGGDFKPGELSGDHWSSQMEDLLGFHPISPAAPQATQFSVGVGLEFHVRFPLEGEKVLTTPSQKKNK